MSPESNREDRPKAQEKSCSLRQSATEPERASVSDET